MSAKKIIAFFRIISTYVENTAAGVLAVSMLRDHLHIRGEYDNDFNIDGHEVGSSPHTWRIPNT